MAMAGVSRPIHFSLAWASSSLHSPPLNTVHFPASQRNWNLCSRASVDDETVAAETAPAPAPARKSRGTTSTGTPKQVVGSRRRKSVTSTTTITEPEETRMVETESVREDAIVKAEKKKQGGDVDDEEEEYDWPPLVCCIGDALHEFVPTVRISERQMHPEIYSSWKGLQWSPPEFIRAPGSTSSNLAIALARLGGRVAFVGKVGDDVFGHEMVLTLNTNGVQTRGVKIAKGLETGVSKLRLTCGTGSGVQMKCEKPSAESMLLPKEINLDIIKEAQMLQCTSISLTYEPLRSTLIKAVDMARKRGAEVFFDVNLPMPYWQDRVTTCNAIEPIWIKATMIEVTKQELEFILGEEIYERRRKQASVYASKSIDEMKQNREEYHYMPDEIEHLWHKDLKILLVTDGTYRIHYYTPDFHGSIEGTEDVLITPFTCDRTGSGDALVAAVIRKLSTQPQLLGDQDKLEKALRFAICAGIIAQWTIGAIRGFPTESAAQNLTEQVYPPSMVHYKI